MRDNPASYVPALMVRRLADHREPLTDPRAEILRGAVLFADISGFTALTESLAKRGRRGAEELTQFLNVYFGQLIDLMCGKGGDVLKFAGDALIAYWPSDVDGMATATLRATECALIAQQQLHDYPAAADVRLSLRIGIGAGTFSLFNIGGVNGRWEIVVSGAALKQMGGAKEQDEPGEVTLSREAWALIAADAEGQELRDGVVRVDRLRRPPEPAKPAPLPNVDPRAFLAYVPRAVVHHLVSGDSGWLAELRAVTVLFVNFPGLTPATPIERAQEVMRDLQTILFRYEAQINKLSVDDKGASLVAAFGLPPLAHEDDAARAVAAALEMRDRLRAMNVAHAIGVATGLTFCGVVGNSTRREYTMMGDVVNLSARLMQAVHNDVLCDHATYEASHTRMAFEALPPIHVKGKADALPIYRPQQAVRATAEPAEHTSPIVGRAAERAQLHAMLDRAGALGGGAIAILEGEAGAGKSRLAADVAERARETGVACLYGHGDALERSTPFHAWRPIFDRLLALDPAWTRDERRQQVERRLGEREDRWKALLPLLNPVLLTDFPDTEATAALQDHARADTTHDLLADLLIDWHSGMPLLVSIDDAHWMDSASWHLITDIGHRGLPHLIIVSMRTGSDAADDAEGLAATPAATRLSIGRVSDDEAVAIACAAIAVDNLPPEVERIVRKKADGNPLFVEELARTLKESGLLLIDGRQCRLAPAAGDLDEFALPDTVQGAVIARIDRLAASQRTILKVAAVAGRVFDRDVVERLYPGGTDAASVAADLDALCTSRITRHETAERAKTFAFTQLIFQDVSYNLMLFSQRRQLHQAMAEWLEQSAAGDIDRILPALAAHWNKAVAGGGADPALVAKAVDYLRRAGEQAVGQSANREAVVLFEDALHLLRELPDTPDRAQQELRLCSAVGAPLIATRGFAAPEVERTYARAWELCHAVGHSPERFGAILGLWVHYLVKTELGRARELAEELVRSADAMGIPDLQLPAHRVMGDTAFWMGDFSESVEHQDQAIAIYDPARHHAAAVRRNGQDPGVVCRVMAAWSLWMLGDRDTAFKRVDEALALATELKHSHSFAIAVHNQAQLLQFDGNAQATLETSERLIELASAEGFAMWLAAGTVFHGWATSELDDAERGCAEMARGIADFRATGALLAAGYHLGLLASGSARAGKLDDAIDYCDKALAATATSGEDWWRPDLLRQRAEFELQRTHGDRAAAIGWLREAIDVADHQTSRVLADRARTCLSHILGGST